jgi:GNAT superfamily N-acetyltransferase
MPRPILRYAEEPSLPVAEYRRVLLESGLGRIRPIRDEARLSRMLDGADLVLTARLDAMEGRLVGVLRAIGDGAWVCYVSDLAVVPAAQRLGVGRGLMRALRDRLGPEIAVVVSAAQGAAPFYERIGMDRVPDVFRFPRGE